MDYDPCPCDDCGMEESCDHWEARYCCTRCRWLFGENTPCDDCDPMDI